jgi:dCMP deaminase
MMPFKWDLRFLSLAKLVSTWSKDPSTKVGAVIVRPDHSIVSVGFNGFPRNMEDKPEWYLNREEKYSRIVHAEVNALIQAKTDVTSYTLYTYPFMCCDRCVVQMLQAGIGRFVFPVENEEVSIRWGDAFQKTMDIIRESNIPWDEYVLEEMQ